MCISLKGDKISCLEWYIASAFTEHSNFKFYTGAVLTMGKGEILSVSQKKQINTNSSTEAELVGAYDASSIIFWTNIFLGDQG